MKLFKTIFAVYLLCLSLVPCSDEYSSIMSRNDEAKISALVHHEASHHTDACTPFCHCACCATTVLFQTAINGFTHPLMKAAHEFTFDDAFVSFDNKSIWQPPRLS